LLDALQAHRVFNSQLACIPHLFPTAANAQLLSTQQMPSCFQIGLMLATTATSWQSSKHTRGKLQIGL
jgi:hypothetical protein